MSTLCNPKYFSHLIAFVILFRECLNQINEEKVKNENKDFSELYNAEDVPDISNEFITEFLDCTSDVVPFIFTKEEAIDLTQNFCHWMYEKNFTCSKLSLINNY